MGNLKWKWIGTSVDYCNYSGVIPSEATQYDYDSRENLILVNNPSGTTDLSFTYDNNSNMKSAIRGTVRWDYFYNSFNQLTQEVLSLDGRTFNVEYGYDGLGNESHMTYPSGRKIDFMPNAFGEHTRANNYVHSALYHATGKLKEFKFGNGKTYSQTLNDSLLPERIIVDGLVDLTYNYDGTSNITSITDGIRSIENRTMTYDALDRLKSANGPWGNSTFDYDPLGNLMNKTLGFNNYNYTYDRTKNRLTSITGSKPYTFEYDLHGNVKGNGHFSFAYDKADLLTSVNAGVTASYQYDAQKRRILVTEGLEKTYNIYNKAGKLVHKFSVNGSEPSDYIYLNDLQVAKVDGVPGSQAPLSPAYLSIPEYNSGGSFTVNWPSSESATSYTLQERRGVESWNTVYSGSALTKYLTGRTSESYQYRVKACSLAGCSQYRESAVLGVFNLDDGSIPATIFKAPTTPSSDNDGQFYVDWVAASGATSYELQQKKDSNSWITVQNSAAKTYSANLSTSGTYYFRVRACNNNGCSGYSSTASTLVSILTEEPSCPSHEICLDDPLGELR